MWERPRVETGKKLGGGCVRDGGRKSKGKCFPRKKRIGTVDVMSGRNRLRTV